MGELPLGANLTKYCQIGGCEGHHAYDILPFEIYVMNSDSREFEYVKMSNAELLDAANPSDSKLPYVYDHFQWTHCDEIGVPLRLKGYTTTWSSRASSSPTTAPSYEP